MQTFTNDPDELGFHRAIDAKDDPANLMALADWLEEHGKAVEAAGYRWAVEHQRMPANWDGQWVWFVDLEMPTETPSLSEAQLRIFLAVLPGAVGTGLCDTLRVDYRGLRFARRSDALAALAAAWGYCQERREYLHCVSSAAFATPTELPKALIAE